MYVPHTNEVEVSHLFIYQIFAKAPPARCRDERHGSIRGTHSPGEDKYVNNYKIMGNCCHWTHAPEDRDAQMGELLLGLVQLE